MAFLTLNDWTVPISKGGAYSPNECSDREVAFDGTPLLTLTGHKRKWSFETSALSERASEGLIGMLQGKGDKLSFESSLWSDKGDYSSTTPVATITTAVDGPGTAEVYDYETGARESKFGDGALWVAPATTNLLSSDSADAANAPVGYSALIGSTISGDTTFYMDTGEATGKSVKCVTAASSGSGVATNTATGYVAGAKHSASVHVYTTEALSMRLTLDDGVGTASTDFTSIANAWTRVSVTLTFDATPTQAVVSVTHQSAQVKTFYCDKWQVEELLVDSPWVDGGSSRAGAELDYGDICGETGSLTFAAWVRGPTAERKGDAQRIFSTDNGSFAQNNSDGVSIFRRSGNNDIRVQLRRDDGTTSATNLDYSTSPWDGDWHHIAVVLNARENGTPYAALYYDGAAVVTDSNPSCYPILRGTQTRCNIGNIGGAEPWDGRISEVMILPFAMSDGQVAALAARTSALPQYPKLEAAGDFNLSSSYDPEAVQGMVEKVSYHGVNCDGTYRSYNRKVSFVLSSEDDI